MTAWSAWQLARDLLSAVALVIGYIWLTALTRRYRLLAKELDLHICRSRKTDEPAEPTTGRHEEDQPIGAYELIARIRRSSQPETDIELTQPMGLRLPPDTSQTNDEDSDDTPP